MFHKGNMGYLKCVTDQHSTNTAQHTKHTAALGLLTPVFSGEKAKFPRINLNSFKVLAPALAPTPAQPSLDFVKSAPEQRHRLASLLPFHRDLCESLGLTCLSAHLIQLQVLFGIPTVIFWVFLLPVTSTAGIWGIC